MRFFILSVIFFIILLSCKGLKEQAGELPSEEEATILSLQQETAGMKYLSIVIWEKQLASLKQVEEIKLQHNIIMDAKWTPSGLLFIKSLPINEFITQGEEAKAGFGYYKLMKIK